MEEREKRNPKKKKVQKRNENPITYQNKDVSSKLLAEYLVGRDFSAYGIQLPKIKDVRPTNLPAVEVNELKIDNLFLLEDDSYVLIDYESRYTEANKQKYLGYLARLAKKLYNQYRKYVPIRLVIIYTSDVSKGQTRSLLEMGALRLELTEVFLVDFNGEEIRHRIEEKLCKEEDLGENDLMQLVIYPLMFPGKAAKQDAIRQVITISGKIADITKQKFILKMLLAFTDKFIGEEDARKIKEVIRMTKVERLYEEEKQEAVKKAVKEAVDENTGRIAINMLRGGDSEEKVSSCTGLSPEVVKQLALEAV